MGCGCRGRALAGALRARGHAVRATTRDAGNCAAIAAAGAEPFVADPDRVGTLVAALDGVAVLCLLLGSASGPQERLESLHGDRLEMLLAHTLDTTVRAVAYEAVGTVDGRLLQAGSEKLKAICERSRIPYALLEADPAAPGEWTGLTAAAIEGLLWRGKSAGSDVAELGGERGVPAAQRPPSADPAAVDSPHPAK